MATAGEYCCFRKVIILQLKPEFCPARVGENWAKVRAKSHLRGGVPDDSHNRPVDSNESPFTVDGKRAWQMFIIRSAQSNPRSAAGAAKNQSGEE